MALSLSPASSYDDARSATPLRNSASSFCAVASSARLAAAKARHVRADGPEFGYYGQALQAALDGVGVAMGISPYIDDDLAAGRLRAPFPLRIAKGRRWYLVYRAARAEDPVFRAFRDWIVGAATGG